MKKLEDKYDIQVGEYFVESDIDSYNNYLLFKHQDEIIVTCDVWRGRKLLQGSVAVYFY